MPDVEAVFVVLGLAAFVAGLVDAVVGGGGLIQIPALFGAYPSVAPVTLFATNKLASVVGTSSAAIQYARRVAIPWRVALPGAAAAFIGSWFGAQAVAYLSPEVLRPLILVLLVLVAAYTFARKDFGTAAGDLPQGARPAVRAIAVGAGVGFYDGFFGPGTGSFLIFLFVRWLHMDFLRASVTAKILNVSTNIAAISFFALNVDILWKVAGVMALCNLSGALLGSRLALRHGAMFVRRVFLLVVCALIGKMLYDLVGAG